MKEEFPENLQVYTDVVDRHPRGIPRDSTHQLLAGKQAIILLFKIVTTLYTVGLDNHSTADISLAS